MSAKPMFSGSSLQFADKETALNLQARSLPLYQASRVLSGSTDITLYRGFPSSLSLLTNRVSVTRSPREDAWSSTPTAGRCPHRWSVCHSQGVKDEDSWTDGRACGWMTVKQCSARHRNAVADVGLGSPHS